MADEILFMDGFEHYAANDILKKYEGFIISMDQHTPNSTEITPRFATNGTLNAIMKVDSNNGDKGGYLQKSITTSNDTITVGFAIYLEKSTPSADHTVVSMGPATDDNYIRFDLTSTSEFKMYAQSTLLDTTTTLNIPAATWVHLAFEVKLDSTASGYIKIYKNGVLAHTFNGATDVIPHNEEWASVGVCYIAGPASITGYGVAYWDDLYVKNDGPASTDARVITLIPDAAGAATDFTPNTGTNHDAVNETSDIDDDTTYVENGSIGAKDLYNIDTFTTTPTTIHGVQLNTVCKKTDAVLREFVPMVRHSSTNYDGDAVALNGAYNDELQVWTVNPGTAAAWTPSDIGSLQIGFRVVT